MTAADPRSPSDRPTTDKPDRPTTGGSPDRMPDDAPSDSPDRMPDDVPSDGPDDAPGRSLDGTVDAGRDGRGDDPVVRRAARTATIVALPIALLVGVVVFLTLRGTGDGSPPPPAAGSTSSTPTPVSSSDARGRPAETDTVEMPTAILDPRQTVICRALLSRLPSQLRDRSRRAVTAGSEQNAAWGAPPVTLGCGVPGPAVTPDTQVWLLDGVCWVNHDTTAWSTVDREVAVTVRVPAEYGAGGQWVIEFSGPIVAAVPNAASAPTGCRP